MWQKARKALVVVLVTRGMGVTAAATTMKTMSELTPNDGPNHTGVSLNHIQTFQH